MEKQSAHSGVAIRYERSAITHTTQFILSGGDEELVLDCSSGPIPDDDNRCQLLPIHTRLALPWSAARRLCDSLQQIIQQHDQRPLAAPQGGHVAASTRQARLPRIQTAHGPR